MEKNKSMKEMIEKLNNAADAYYNSGVEIMSNYKYDALYDELVDLEKETGIILPNSPTQKVGFLVMDKLPKEKHEFPALSLNKTKDMSLFPKTFGTRDNIAIVMWKADGSTVVATYDNGKLTKLVTRGNGEIGQVITHNAPYIKGLPMEIPYKGHMVVRGEAVMTYEEFDRINENLPAEQEPYKNPRNLANATITLLDSSEMAQREILFEAFNLVYMDTMPTPDTFYSRFLMLANQGFNLIEFETASGTEELINVMDDFTERIEKGYGPAYPVDGLVVAANDVVYAESQPGTGHNPNKLVGYALKWEDETAETTLREIEWSASRTGLLNPVAIFDPVELEGTTVTRASLHNVSYIKNLRLRIGDKISVFKANKIIPQVLNNLSAGDVLKYHESHPSVCPVCGSNEVTPYISSRPDGQNVEVVICSNPSCAAKLVGKFVHFCERDCMNIEGLSEATVEKFIQRGFLKNLDDIYSLSKYESEIVNMEGFGQKSYDNIISAIEKSKETNFVSFIHSLGIPNIGKGQAKLFAKAFNKDVKEFLLAVENNNYDFSSIEGIGPVISQILFDWGYKNIPTEVSSLISVLKFNDKKEKTDNTLAGRTYVITGSLNQFKNRDALKDFIEEKGGKVAGSVSKNTSFLINNDITSTSGKNQKARELEIPIISEETFLQEFSNVKM